MADAARYPCGAQHFEAAGVFENSVSHRWGASAKIKQRRPEICGPESFGEVWAMIAGAAVNDGWAQVGYGNFGCNAFDPCTYKIFGQTWGCFRTGCPGGRTKILNEGPTGAHDYKVQYGDVCSCLKTFWKGDQVQQTVWDPLEWWNGLMHPEWVGEAFHPESDIPGVIDDQVFIRYMKVKLARSTDTWSDPRDDLVTKFESHWRFKARWDNRPTRVDVYTYPL